MRREDVSPESKKRRKSRAGSLASNNNMVSIRRLAISEVKNSRMRNFFVIVTIMLSVSLLMVISLFTMGFQTELRRQVAKMQHVIYMEADGDSVEKLAKAPETEYVLSSKMGMSIEIDKKKVQFSSYGLAPMKSEGTEVEMAEPVKGERPKAYDEIMISDEYCKVLGIEAEPGQKVSFPFLDGTAEEFTISGIYHVEGAQKVHSVFMSEEYGERGPQLKDYPYSAIVRIHDAEKMDQDTFHTTICDLAEKCGIERKNVNENDHFLHSLPGGDMEVQQNLVIFFVGIGIVFVSVLVIYSVFYLAVVGKIRQFGQLRTIGMTRKQIRKMVRMEGLCLCAVGIPFGLCVGGLVAYLLKPGGWSWKNAILTAIVVIIADIFTVMISVSKPAKIAASVSPVEAAKYSGYENQGNIRGTIKLYRKITPYSLAVMSSSRNRKKTMLTMISLGVGGILYMLASCYVTSVSLEGYARQGSLKYGEFVIGFSSNVRQTTEHGQTGIQMKNPLNDGLQKQIEAMDGVREVLTFQDAEVHFTYNGETSRDGISSFRREDEEAMQKMLEEGALDYDVILENREVVVTYNDLVEEVFGWRFETGDMVMLNWYDGQQEQAAEFRVAAVVDMNEYVNYSNCRGIFVVPEEVLNEMMNGMNLNSEMVIRVEEDKYNEVEAGLNLILEENPELGMQTLKEEEEYAENQFSVIFAVFIGLSIFIVAFSILNLLNTLITNILTRKHELAMLQSVGMTTRQVTKMVQLEGLRLMIGNLVIVLTLGSLAGWGYVNIMWMFDVNYVSYKFPGWFFLGYAVFTILVTVIVSTVMVKSFQKQALVERLRE